MWLQCVCASLQCLSKKDAGKGELIDSEKEREEEEKNKRKYKKSHQFHQSLTSW